MHSYINNDSNHAFLTKKHLHLDWAQKRRTARQLIRKNPVCCLKNQAIFFHRANVQIGLAHVPHVRLTAIELKYKFQNQ